MQYHDSYFVVAHFHYVLVPGAIFSIFSAVYYWLPKWSGKMYSSTLSQLHFWLSAISVNLTFFPMHLLGLAGMQRRVSDYALYFVDMNKFVSGGAFLFGLSQLIFLLVLYRCITQGKPASASPWEGAHGLEWTVPSPAPYHTFEEVPVVN